MLRVLTFLGQEMMHFPQNLQRLTTSTISFSKPLLTRRINLNKLYSVLAAAVHAEQHVPQLIHISIEGSSFWI